MDNASQQDQQQARSDIDAAVARAKQRTGRDITTQELSIGLPGGGHRNKWRAHIGAFYTDYMEPGDLVAELDRLQ